MINGDFKLHFIEQKVRKTVINDHKIVIEIIIFNKRILFNEITTLSFEAILYLAIINDNDQKFLSPKN